MNELALRDDTCSTGEHLALPVYKVDQPVTVVPYRGHQLAGQEWT